MITFNNKQLDPRHAIKVLASIEDRTIKSVATGAGVSQLALSRGGMAKSITLTTLEKALEELGYQLIIEKKEGGK